MIVLSFDSIISAVQKCSRDLLYILWPWMASLLPFFGRPMKGFRKQAAAVCDGLECPHRTRFPGLTIVRWISAEAQRNFITQWSLSTLVPEKPCICRMNEELKEAGPVLAVTDRGLHNWRGDFETLFLIPFLLQSLQ
jgi:hypothetical protein